MSDEDERESVPGEPAERPSRPSGDDWTEVRESWVGNPPAETADPQIIILAETIEPPPRRISPPLPAAEPAPLLRSAPPPLPASEAPRPRSVPPLLPGSQAPRPRSAPPPPGSPPEPTERLAMARALFDVDDDWGALLACDAVLERDPGRAEALGLRERCGERLERAFLLRLGSFDRVPRLVAREAGLPPAAVDPLAGLVLAQIDGVRSVAAIAGSAVLPRLHTLRILSELWLRGLVDVS
jgi:hypothetical protein